MPGHTEEDQRQFLQELFYRLRGLDAKELNLDSWLTSLGVSATERLQNRTQFRIPRWVFPVIPVSTSGAVWPILADSTTTLQTVPLVLSREQAFNSTAWAPRQGGSTKAVPASGASPLTIWASAGAGLKRRIFDLTLTSSVAGVVVLSDGLGSIRLGTASSVYVHYGPDGVLQDTAATAITATLATATLEAISVGNAGE